MSLIPSPEQKFVQKSNVFGTQIKDELVMVCLDRDLYFSLDEIGVRIWRILEKPHGLREIADKMTREYDVDIAAATENVAALLRDLLTNGLILPAPRKYLGEVNRT